MLGTRLVKRLGDADMGNRGRDGVSKTNTGALEGNCFVEVLSGNNAGVGPPSISMTRNGAELRG
jgi:hypothetical protein